MPTERIQPRRLAPHGACAVAGSGSPCARLQASAGQQQPGVTGQLRTEPGEEGSDGPTSQRSLRRSDAGQRQVGARQVGDDTPLPESAWRDMPSGELPPESAARQLPAPMNCFARAETQAAAERVGPLQVPRATACALDALSCRGCSAWKSRSPHSPARRRAVYLHAELPVPRCGSLTT